MRNARLYEEQDYVITFLIGLNDQFSIVRSQILLMNLLLPPDKVFSLIFQQEQQGNSVALSEANPSVKIEVETLIRCAPIVVDLVTPWQQATESMDFNLDFSLRILLLYTIYHLKTLMQRMKYQ